MFHLLLSVLCMCEESWHIDYFASVLPTLPLSSMSGWLSVDTSITAYYCTVQITATESQFTVGSSSESWNYLLASYLMSCLCSKSFFPTILCSPWLHWTSFHYFLCTFALISFTPHCSATFVYTSFFFLFLLTDSASVAPNIKPIMYCKICWKHANTKSVPISPHVKFITDLTCILCWLCYVGFSIMLLKYLGYWLRCRQKN